MIDLHLKGTDTRVHDDTFAAAILASRSHIGACRPDDGEPEEQWLWDKLTTLLDASHKSSEARKAELKAAQDDGHDCAIRYVLGYLNGAGDCGSTYYEEILGGCGRERIIQSAIEDGELEFTGLGDYIKQYGTTAEKRKVRAALRAQAQAGDAEVAGG